MAGKTVDAIQLLAGIGEPSIAEWLTGHEHSTLTGNASRRRMQARAFLATIGRLLLHVLRTADRGPEESEKGQDSGRRLFFMEGAAMRDEPDAFRAGLFEEPSHS